jgi:hypothetical protein
MGAEIVILAILALAAAPDPLPPEHPFSWLDAGRCPPEAAEAYLARASVVDALLGRYPLRVSAASLTGGAADIPSAIADSDCASPSCSANEKALSSLYGAVEDMLRLRQGRRFELVWAGQGAEPASERERVRAFYDLAGPEGYRVRCLVPGREPAAGGDGAPPNWRVSVGATLADLAKPLGQREFASVSLRGDEEADTLVGTVRGVVGATWIGPDLAGGTQRFAGGPYLAYERVSNPNPAKAVNNVELGFRGVWLFYPGARDPEAAYPTWTTLSTAWLTDDEGDSSAWRAELAIRPGLGRALFQTGYGYDRTVIDAPDYFVTARWDLNLAADYVSVEAAGEKTAWLTMPEYLRWGYDLSGELRLRWRERAPTVGLGASYQFRDDLDHAGGNADRLTGRLKYYPSDDSRWTFGLEYDRGENLQSLEPLENWLVTLGYRQ